MTDVGPFTPIQYAQWFLNNSQATVSSTRVILNNSNGDWDHTQKSGNTVATKSDSSTHTISFLHANYIGPQQTGIITPSTDLHPEQIAALGINANDSTNWTLIILGIGEIAAGILVGFFAGWSGIGAVAAASLIITGAATLLAVPVITVFTPTLQTQTCNTDNTNCCYDYTSASSGLISTCNTCSGTSCKSTTTQTGGLTGFLGEIEYIIIIGAVVVVIVLVLYFVLKWRSSSPKSSGSFVAVPAGAYG